MEIEGTNVFPSWANKAVISKCLGGWGLGAGWCALGSTYTPADSPATRHACHPHTKLLAGQLARRPAS